MRRYLTYLFALFIIQVGSCQRGSDLMRASYNQWTVTSGGDPLLVGIQGSWSLEDSGTTSDENTGQVSQGSMTSGTVATADGYFGAARDFDGTNGISFPTNADLQIEDTEAVTLLAYIRPDALGESGTSIVAGQYYLQSGSHQYYIGYRPDGTIRVRVHPTTGLVDFNPTATGALALNEWHQILFRWQTGEPMRVYIDGTEYVDTGNPVSTALVTTTLPFFIGGGDTGYSGYGIREFPGRIDNVIMWDRKISDAEANQIVNTDWVAEYFKSYGDHTIDDTDALAFVEAVQTDGDDLTATQEEAVDNLAGDLKSNGTWGKYLAIYPFVGGTATAHRWNLKDPRDLDAAHRLTFFGSNSTHDDQGYTGNPVANNTDYARTHITTNDFTYSSGTVNGMFTYYSVNNITGTSGASSEIGARGNGSSTISLLQVNDGGGFWTNFGTTNMAALNNGRSDRYVAVGGRNGYAVTHVNGIKYDSIQQTGAIDTNDMFLIHNQGDDLTGNPQGSTSLSSNRTAGFVSFSLESFMDYQMLADWEAIQRYNQALGRAVPGDVDVVDFVAAVEGDGTDLTAAEIKAVDDLVAGYKSNGTWAKYDAIYPFVGGTASAHKYNLKDPRDLDAAYRLQYVATVTHDDKGATGNGTSGYSDTHYANPSFNDFAMSVYVNSDASTNSDDQIEMGIYANNVIYTGSSAGSYLGTKRSDTSLTVQAMQGEGGQAGRWFPVDDGRANKYLVSSLVGTEHTLYKNGRGLAQRVEDPHDAGLNNFPIYLNGNANTGSAPNPGPYPNGLSNQTLALATIGQALTLQEAEADFANVQAYQEALGRHTVPGDIMDFGQAAGIGAKEADATTGWTNGNGTTFASVARGSGFAVQMTNIGTTFTRGEYSISVQSGVTYDVTYDYRVSTYSQGECRTAAWTGVVTSPDFIWETDGTWRTRTERITTNATTLLMRFYNGYSTTGNGNVIQVDNLKIVPVHLYDGIAGAEGSPDATAEPPNNWSLNGTAVDAVETTTVLQGTTALNASGSASGDYIWTDDILTDVAVGQRVRASGYYNVQTTGTNQRILFFNSGGSPSTSIFNLDQTSPGTWRFFSVEYTRQNTGFFDIEIQPSEGEIILDRVKIEIIN